MFSGSAPRPTFWTDSYPLFCSALSQRCHSSTLSAFACPWGCREVAGTSSTPSREQDSRTLPHGHLALFSITRQSFCFNKLFVLFLGIWFQAWTCQISLSQRVKTLSCLNFTQSMNSISSNLYVLAALSSFVNNQRLFLMSFPLPKSSSLVTPYWCSTLSHFWHGRTLPVMSSLLLMYCPHLSASVFFIPVW